MDKTVSIPLGLVGISVLAVSTGYIDIPYQYSSIVSNINPLETIVIACILYADDALSSTFRGGIQWVYRITAGAFISYLCGGVL